MANSNPPAPVFTYTVTPATIDYSSPAGLSIVALAITVTNGTAGAVTCLSIAFSLPPGAQGNDLFPVGDGGLIVASTGVATPWAIAPAGDASYVAMPLPPATGLGAGDSIEFVFSNIIVNEVSGIAAIAIVETTIDANTQTPSIANASVTVTKTEAAPPSGGGAPQIASFTATPAAVALGGQTLLAWNVNNATACVLDPGAVPLPSASDGTVPVTLSDTTTFTLTAVSSGGTTPATVTVTVMPVSIVSFTIDPATVAAGSPATLQWSTQYASSCSIDQGIGPVVLSGSQIVTPQETTTYTLTANGLDPQTATTTVTVS